MPGRNEVGRHAAIVVGACLLLTACMPGVPYSRQSMAMRALIDPGLEPLRGCDALDGEWQNQGQRIDGHRVQAAVLTGAMGVAEALPDAAFADRVRFAIDTDGSLVVTPLDRTGPMAPFRVPAVDVDCTPERAQLTRPAQIGMSVDSDGALWLKIPRGLLSIRYSYRFLPADVLPTRCAQARGWPDSAPDGMATVVVGVGDHQATVTGVGANHSVVLVQDGKPSRAEAIYLRPGEHAFDVLVWTPGTYWTDRPQATIAARTTVQACHVYLPVGWHRDGGESWAALVDMGTDFSRRCVSTLDQKSMAVELSPDASRLVVREYCFAHNRPIAPGAPPREIPVAARPEAN